MVRSQAPSPTGCPLSANASAFDPFADAYQIDPAEYLRWSRDDEPVFFSPKLGYWVVTRYDDVKAVFRDNLLFSPAIALEKVTPAPPEAEHVLRTYGYAMGRTMVNEDEPAHMERRRLLLDSFAPGALQQYVPMVRRHVRTYMDRFIDKGEADLIAEMLWEIPLTVALHFLGVKENDVDRLRQFSLAHTTNIWGRPSREEQVNVAEKVGRFWQAANSILDKMMEDPTGDGWMYFSIRQHLRHPHAVPLSYLRSMMMAILAAAHETTSKASANAIRLLLSDRAVWTELCENPALIPNAVEECLRRSGSIIAWRRVATADTAIDGVAIPKGAKLLLVMATANHDERHFENPDELNPYRDNAADHLSFGYGAHQCMGKNLARLQMRIILEEFSARLPHMELLPGRPVTYIPNIAFRGADQLWVRWDPALNPERRYGAVPQEPPPVKIGAPAAAEVTREVRIVSVAREADGVTSIALEGLQGKVLPAWEPGAHIDLLVGGYERKYSLCGRPGDRMTYQIAVLKEANGRGASRYIHEHLSSGDRLRIRGPKTHFRLQDGGPHYVLVAGGIGITPILTMADRLKQEGKSYVIHYCGRTRASMAFLTRLQCDHGTNLRVYAKDEGKRLDLRLLAGDLSPGSRVYACGPERMLIELQGLAEGWPRGTLHTEFFAGTDGSLDPTKEREFEVELRDSNLLLAVPRDKTLLQVLQATGIDVACDCREGLCGSCEIPVLEGAVDHRDRVLTREERERNVKMMACCSRAKGGKLVLAL